MTYYITINKEELNKLFKNANLAKKGFEEAFERSLDDWADYVFARSQDLCPSGAFNMLRTSADIYREEFFRSVFYRANYAIYVEFGTAPHMPPVEPLVPWSKRVLSSKNPEDTAWAVAKKIEREGTEPNPFLRTAFDEAKPKIFDWINKEIKKVEEAVEK